MKTTVYDMTKNPSGEIELDDKVFSVKIKPSLLHEVVCAQLSNRRQGNAANKTRRDVRGGGKKPYRQKGTGRARHGSSRSPIFVGGGSTFGPKPRDWHIELPKKQRKVALRMAVSQKNQDGNLFVVNEWISKTGKTSDMARVLKGWNLKSGLIVAKDTDKKTALAIRNIPNVRLMREGDLNVYDLLRYEHCLMTEGAVKSVTERLV